jgi:hypothetical protein
MTKDKGGKIKQLNAADVIRSNPRMYWGVECPTVDVVNTAILEQFRAEGCKSVVVEKIPGWQVISTETNWVESLVTEQSDVKNIFLDLKGFPGGGGNGLRFEYLLYLLVNDLCISINGVLTIVKGSMDEGLKQIVQKKSLGKVAICYSENVFK